EENQIDVIAFRFGELFNFITNHSELEVVGELSINEWNGNRTVQIIAEDMAVNEKQIFDYRGKKARTNLQPYIDHYEKIIIVEENQIDVIAFRFGELFNFITNHSELEVVGELSINEWNGNRTVQIIAEDMAVNEKQIFDYRGKKARTNLQPYIDHYEKIIIVE